MILRRLRLTNFRSYSSLDLSFDDGLTLIVGDNGEGKTNLAEAINYLSLSRSWRTPEDAPLIQEGETGALIEAEIEEGMLRRKIGIELTKEGKKVTINGKVAKRLSDLSRLCNVLLFTPSDVSFFRDGPGVRRSFLDMTLSKQSADYMNLLSRYGRLLKERNAALKTPAPDRVLLQVLGKQMGDVALPLVTYRSMYVQQLGALLPGLLESLTGRKEACKLSYRPFAKPDGSFPKRVEKLFEESLEGDLKRGFTSVGPHREDLRMLLNGKDIAEYGSQGENRSAVLALKLAPFFLVDSPERKPICVLDDVTSELDENRVSRLLSLLGQLGQVFVTATQIELPGASYIDVTKDKAVRR